MKIADLRPGMPVDLIVSMDHFKEKTDIRRAILYGMEKSRIILSQTSPRLASSQIGRNLDVTFLSRSGGRQVRLGFTAKLLSFQDDYRLLSKEGVPAMVMAVDPKQDFTKYNLRMFHRIKPITKSDIKLFIRNTGAPITDISIGGLCYVYPFGAPVEVGNRFPAKLEIGRSVFTVDLKVVRIWSPPELRKNGLKYLSVEFENADKKMSSLLSGKILEIERELLSRGRE